MPLDDLAATYTGGSEYGRTMRERLAAEPARRWGRADLETELGWPRGPIAGVSGGYAQGRQKQFDGNRRMAPALDERRVREIWMDVERAAAIKPPQE